MIEKKIKKQILMVYHEDLQELTGYQQPADIAVCLTKHGIPFFTGKRGRIWTTANAFDCVLGLTQPPVLDNDIDEVEIQ